MAIDSETKDESIAVGIYGRNLQGDETNPLAINPNQKLMNADIVSVIGQTSAITVSTTPIEAKPTTDVTNAVLLYIENQGSTNIYWSFLNSNSDGHIIRPFERVTFRAGIKVYLYTLSGSNTSIIVSKGA